MSRGYRSLLVLLAAAGACVSAATLELDASQTKVIFSLGARLHTVHGTFRLKQGHLDFDPSTGSMSGDVIVDASSANSGIARRDERMRREVLESERYPEIRFSPKRFTGTLSTGTNSQISVRGSFQIHGQQHEMTVPLRILMTGDKLTLRGKFVLPYVAWGMKDPSNFILKVDQEVTIEIIAVGRVKR